jgi:hypothetical protein
MENLFEMVLDSPSWICHKGIIDNIFLYDNSLLRGGEPF